MGRGQLHLLFSQSLHASITNWKQSHIPLHCLKDSNCLPHCWNRRWSSSTSCRSPSQHLCLHLLHYTCLLHAQQSDTIHYFPPHVVSVSLSDAMAICYFKITSIKLQYLYSAQRKHLVTTSDAKDEQRMDTDSHEDDNLEQYKVGDTQRNTQTNSLQHKTKMWNMHRNWSFVSKMQVNPSTEKH